MASRLMHLAVSQGLERVLPIRNANDFRVGQILPDAVLSADKKEVNSHFIKILDNGKSKVFDFIAFYDRYKREVLSEEIYLGYYFHLIEDNLFRKLIYYDLGLLSRRGEPEFLAELYSDYHILNGIIAEKYLPDSDLQIPQGFSDMTLNEIYPFEIGEFIEDMRSDLSERIPGEPRHLSQKVLDKFISDCKAVCHKEYEAVKRGEHSIDLHGLSFGYKI